MFLNLRQFYKLISTTVVNYFDELIVYYWATPLSIVLFIFAQMRLKSSLNPMCIAMQG